MYLLSFVLSFEAITVNLFLVTHTNVDTPSCSTDSFYLQDFTKKNTIFYNNFKN